MAKRVFWTTFNLLCLVGIAVMFWWAVGCGDPGPDPVPRSLDPVAETCSGQWVTVCNPDCVPVCVPRLTPEIAEACTEICRDELEPVACAWDCAREAS